MINLILARIQNSVFKQENNKSPELIVKYLSAVWSFQALNLNIWKRSLLLLLFRMLLKYVSVKEEERYN